MSTQPIRKQGGRPPKEAEKKVVKTTISFPPNVYRAVVQLTHEKESNLSATVASCLLDHLKQIGRYPPPHEKKRGYDDSMTHARG